MWILNRKMGKLAAAMTVTSAFTNTPVSADEAEVRETAEPNAPDKRSSGYLPAEHDKTVRNSVQQSAQRGRE